MYQGHAAGRESTTNTHIINVYNVPLDVYKTDGNNQPLAGATFKLYREDESGSAVAGLDSAKRYTEVAAATSGTDGIARLKHEGADFGLALGEKYYLIETQAPENYSKDSTVWEVEVQTEIGKFTDLEGNILYSTITPDPEGEPPVEVGAGVTNDMYPFNWDQGARIVLDGNDPVLVIAKGETEGSTVQITDGSFVSHEKAISFRHTVLNLIGGEVDIDIEKRWEGDEGQNRPSSVTVTLYRVSEKDHVWGEGVVVPSTCTAAGNKEYTCSACGEKKTEVISVAGHTAGTAHRENETAATCTAAGGYDTVVRCTVCNAIISSEPTSFDALGHDWGEWQVTTPAQPGVAGVETRVCNHDASHVETREIPALPNTTRITYSTYCDWNGNGWLGTTNTTADSYSVGSSITVSWRSQSTSTTVYVNGTAQFINNSYNGYTLTGQTVSAIRTNAGNGWYNYSVTLSVTEDMSIFLKTGDWNRYPSDITITPNRSMNAAVSKSLKLSPAKALLSTDSEPMRSGSTATDPVTVYLDTIAEKTDATCAETEGAVHTYKEVAGTYTISGTGNTWTLNIPDLPQNNEYGKPYTYYVVETPVEGYETTYSGQDNGLTGGTVTITNTKKAGSLKITKAVTVDDAATDTSSLTNGTYTFSISGVAGTATEGISHTVSITFENGRATGYAIDGGAVQPASGTDNTWAVIVPDLVPGSYTISETDSGNLVLKTVTGGSSVSDNVATVIVTDQDTSATTAAAQVVFTNNIETTTVRVQKVWENGSNANPPSSLTVHLSNGESRELNASNNWSATISGLPKVDPATGDPIVYSWTEESLPAGYYLSSVSEIESEGVEITTFTNTHTDSYDPQTTIKGKKIWDDNGSADRPAQITVNLYQGSSTTAFRTITVNAPAEGDQEEWPFEFTNLPIFDENGNIIQYRVEEVLPEGYASNYNVKTEFTAATYVAGEITGEVISSGQGSQTFDVSKGVELGYIVIKHGNNFVIWTPRRPSQDEVQKIRQKAKDLSNDFSDITNVTQNYIYYGDTTPGSNAHTIQVIWGVPRTINVGPKPAVSFAMDGDTVQMTFLNPNAWSAFCYGQIPYTYTPAGGEGGGSITNIKKIVDISGTKTWVDSGREHDNAQEITLALKRTIKPVTDESEWEDVSVAEPITFAWNGNTYTYSNLPRYQDVNDTSTEYEYKVEETDVNVTEGEGEAQQTIQYVSAADGNDFTNTEVTTIEATKTWKDGDNPANAIVTNASVTFELQRQNGDDTWTPVAPTDTLTNPVTMTVGDAANESAWRAAWANLPRYELVEGVPTEIKYRVVETVATLAGAALAPGDPVVVTAGQPTNIDNYLPVDLTILKVDSNGMSKPLRGATFTIQQINETDSVLSLIEDTLETATATDGSAETGTDGIVTFTGLTAGYYMVKETKLPDGYVLLGPGSFFIKVENGKVALVEKNEDGGWVASAGNAKLEFSAANETDPATAIVGNDAGCALPSTGGPGTRGIEALGLGLIALALAGLLRRRRGRA